MEDLETRVKAIEDKIAKFEAMMKAASENPFVRKIMAGFGKHES